MDKRVRAEQRALAQDLRRQDLTWVSISRRLRCQWPELNPRAAMRTAHGWTQRQAAHHWNELWPDLPKTDGEIGLMENRRLGLGTLEKLARLYHCAVADLLDDAVDYSHLDRCTDQAKAVPPALGSTALTESWDGHAAETVAELLASAEIGGTPVEDTVARIIHQWLVTPPPHQVELAAGARIGSGLVAKLEQRVAQLRRLDDFVGGRDLQVLVEQELQLTAGVLRNATYNDRLGRRLLAAIGELCWLAGWVAVDAGDNRQALRRYSAGIRATHAADDRQGAANLISSVAYLLTNQGRFDEAITTSRTALAGADQGGVTPTVRALLGERLAWAHANAGNIAHTERALDQVDLDFDRRDTEQDPDWIYWLDRDEIDVMAARCMDRLGDPNNAIDLLSDILHRYHPDKTRERALYTATLAEAHLHAGDIDQAGTTALQVAQLAGTTSSTRSDDRVHGLVQLLEPMGSVSTVSDFLDSARQA